MTIWQQGNENFVIRVNIGKEVERVGRHYLTGERGGKPLI